MSEWIDINDREPTEDDTCDGRVVVLDCDGYAIIGVLARGKIFSELPFTHWAPIPKPLTKR